MSKQTEAKSDVLFIYYFLSLLSLSLVFMLHGDVNIMLERVEKKIHLMQRATVCRSGWIIWSAAGISVNTVSVMF